MTDEGRSGPRGGRPRQGSVRVRSLADGSRIFELRFRAYGERQSITLQERPGCDCGCGGGWTERAARRELADTLARVTAGVIREAAEAASGARAREGLPPLPRTTPHSLRRTYISIALRANNYDVKGS